MYNSARPVGAFPTDRDQQHDARSCAAVGPVKEKITRSRESAATVHPMFLSTRTLGAALLALAFAAPGCDQGQKSAVEGKPGDKAKAGDKADADKADADKAGDKEAAAGPEGEGEGEPGTKVVVDENGNKVITKTEDGKTIVEAKDADGNEAKVVAGENGVAVEAKNADGTETKVVANEDGTKVESKDGDVTTDKDGDVHVKGKGANEGDDVKVGKDGAIEVKDKSGKTVKVGKDGSVDLGKVPGL